MTLQRDNSGQALLEVAFILPLLAVLVFGIVDYSRALHQAQVISNLSGEGSSMASRGTGLGDTVTAMMGDADLDMSGNGCVIVTQVTTGAQAGSFVVTGQSRSNPCSAGGSRIGCAPPAQGCGQATIPPAVQTVLQTAPNYTIYVTEVFYSYSPITPVGSFLHNNQFLPSQLYSAAYY